MWPASGVAGCAWDMQVWYESRWGGGAVRDGLGAGSP